MASAQFNKLISGQLLFCFDECSDLTVVQGGGKLYPRITFKGLAGFLYLFFQYLFINYLKLLNVTINFVQVFTDQQKPVHTVLQYLSMKCSS